MNYEEKFSNVTVLGAAGKMGSGILLLIAMEMANQKLKPENKDRKYVVNAMDVSDEGLAGLMDYVKAQVTKVAEKQTVALRKSYAERQDLIENSEIINQYVFDVLSVIRPTTSLSAAYDSNLIFEAIKEDPELKVKIFTQVEQNNSNNPWYFTNTSSIPINELDTNAGLGGRILGLHFYNPPAVQKLVEVIKAKTTLNELDEFAELLIKNLRKKKVPSNDFAGFIGNGHFMRDALYAISEVDRLAADMPFVEAVYIMNKVSQEYLVRPMGIFQLVDYVGVDVCQYIMSVMNPYLDDEDLHSPLLDNLISQGILGGQYASGAQKDGILKYEKGRPVAIYDPDKKDYVAIEQYRDKCDEKLGAVPGKMIPWKAVIASPSKNDMLEGLFSEYNSLDTLGVQLAKAYGKRSKDIGLKLVSDNVAFSEDDVNTVMLTGFFHAYGPINNYFN